jgi:membrane protease YdiL (CAAX protease family)
MYLVNAVVTLIPALAAGWLCGRMLENLPFRALGAWFTRGWLKHFVLGCVIGGLTLSFAVLIAVVFGGLHFRYDAEQTTNSIIYSLAISFVIFAVASAFEEVLCRGYFLQTMSRSGLAWLGIAITSLVFGVGHLGNPDAGVVSTANTVLAGLWFSIAYLKTRDLWFVWGLHLMWNWMQGSFFGIEVSGITNLASAPLLREIDAGPRWLTGTTYGVEGGIVCTIALIVSTIAIYYLPIAKPDPELRAMTTKSEPPA